MSGLLEQLSRPRWVGAARVSRSEGRLLIAACALGALVVVLYALIVYPTSLAGDQSEYDSEGRYFADGKLWWSELPYGEPGPSAWKAPGYATWVGSVYALAGRSSPTAVALLQGLLIAPLTVLLSWALARRLFDPSAALASAFGVAVFPLSWEYIGLLYPEALAIPLTLIALQLILATTPTQRVAIALGLVVGVGMLVRPNLFFLLAGALAGWTTTAGWRRGFGFTALAASLAVLVIAPWTIRNTFTDGVGFVPISLQDSSVYGTFNDDAANDPERPYQWRAFIEPMPEVFSRESTDDAELRSELIDEARSYVADHPESVLGALYWNGLRRFWDLRTPERALEEVEPMGRSRPVAIAGLGAYYVILPLALLGLWRTRGRREVVLASVAIMVVASASVIAVSATRYRAPLEPLLVIFAASAIIGPGSVLTPTRLSPAASRRCPERPG